MRIGDRLSWEGELTDTAKSVIPRPVYSQFVSFAGKPLLVQSNSAAILNHASSFFAQCHGEGTHYQVAELKLMLRVNDCRETEDSPWFRGRGYFAFARFTRADSIWFNLRTRRAFGTFSPATVADAVRWHKDIFPAVVGILAPVINVVPVHAACVSKDDFGILLAGQSGAGKSTLAITVAQLGYNYLSDDWTYLAQSSAGVEAWSVPAPVKLLPDATDYFPELADQICAKSLNAEIAYEVSPQACFGLPRIDHCRVRCVVFLKRVDEPGYRISSVGAADAVSRLQSDIEPLNEPLMADYQAQLTLLRGLSDATCFEISFNASPRDIARAIDSAVAKLIFSAPNRAAAQDLLTIVA